MTLCDTAPLIALVNVRDKNYGRCVLTLKTLQRPLITTWPCFAEAMHLCHRNGGYPAQQALWRFVGKRVLTFHDLSAAEIAQMPLLMEKYRDTPMDLADASLVVAAQTLGAMRIFTLDSDFYVYRLENGAMLQIVP